MGLCSFKIVSRRMHKRPINWDDLATWRPGPAMPHLDKVGHPLCPWQDASQAQFQSGTFKGCSSNLAN